MLLLISWFIAPWWWVLLESIFVLYGLVCAFVHAATLVELYRAEAGNYVKGSTKKDLVKNFYLVLGGSAYVLGLIINWLKDLKAALI